jgi:hypothetical protein
MLIWSNNVTKYIEVLRIANYHLGRAFGCLFKVFMMRGKACGPISGRYTKKPIYSVMGESRFSSVKLRDQVEKVKRWYIIAKGFQLLQIHHFPEKFIPYINTAVPSKGW